MNKTYRQNLFNALIKKKMISGQIRGLASRGVGQFEHIDTWQFGDE